MYFLIAARKKRLAAAALFSAIAALGPLYWLAHNWWIYSNPLEFFNGYYAPMSIYRRALAQNMLPYPGDHDWPAAMRYYLMAVRLCVGWTAVAIGIAGLAAAFARRLFWPVLFAALPPVFYVWSMHSGNAPIYRSNAVALFLLQHSLRAHRAAATRHRRRRPGLPCTSTLASMHRNRDRDCGRRALAHPPAAQSVDHLERVASQLHHSPRVDPGSRVVTRRLLPFWPRHHHQL